MDYEKLMNKKHPFKGLSLEERKRLLVYMLHMASPSLSIGEIEKRWGNVLPKEEYPSAFEALEIADSIRKEGKVPSASSSRRSSAHSGSIKKETKTSSTSSASPRSSVHPSSHSTEDLHDNKSGHPGCLLLMLILGACAVGLYMNETNKRNPNKLKSKELLRIDEGFFRNPRYTYEKLCNLPVYTEAGCRKCLCERFGIGRQRALFSCPIGVTGLNGGDDCLGRAAQSKAFCESMRESTKSASFPISECDIEGLRALRRECERFPQLRQCSTNLLYRIAEAGNAKECLELALCHDRGVGVEKDDIEADKWYSKFIACANKGEVYRLNDQTLKRLAKSCERTGQLEKAIPYYERCAELGDSQVLYQAMKRLAKSCEQTGELEKAISYYERCAELGDSQLLYIQTMKRLAKSCEQTVELEKARFLYERCAKLGDSQAILWMGNYWWNRWKRDNSSYSSREEAFENAVLYLERAATGSRDADVFMKLSSLHTGRQRVSDLRNAANLGNVEAAFKLGSIYATGKEGCIANKAEAKKWYLMAAKKGDARAQLSYAEHLDSPDEAFDWVLKSAEQGNVEAQYQLGRLYDFYGWGAWGREGSRWTTFRSCHEKSYGDKQTVFPVDDSGKYKAKAIDWYRIAARNNHREAERELSRHGATLE